MATKRKAGSSSIGDLNNDFLEFTNLGAGNEVGRSCHIIQYKGKTVMLDAGVHPALNGMAALPFYDEFDLSEVDLLLISHFHLDHAASLPYVVQKTNFRGRIFMTHPTKAILKWLLADYVRVSNVDTEDQLFSEKDVSASLERAEAIDYHATIEVEGIKFTSYPAGHVLGAAMFLIEIAGVKTLFTGDYSREENRHLMAAQIPPVNPDILITESTFGTATLQPRPEKETRLTSLIHSIIRRGGRCLLPVFALGEVQELVLVLDEYWHNHPELHGVPIYYASNLAKKCMAVYSTYINMMNDNIRKRGTERNPFELRYVENLRSLDKFADLGPCVNGISRHLLEKWVTDVRNGLIIVGYCVEGTMAKHILTEPAEIQTMSGQKLPRRMTIEEISFAAHVDYTQNSEFIYANEATHIILVHGEFHNMLRLKSALKSHYKNEKTEIHSPRNCEMIRLEFKGEKVAKVMGTLAKYKPQEGDHIDGILLQKDFQMSILAPEDLEEFSGLNTTVIVERQTVAFHSSPALLRYHLESMFGAIDTVVADEKRPTFRVMDCISLAFVSEYRLRIEWIGNLMNDTIADAVLAIVMSAESSPASVILTSQPCRHAHITPTERLERIRMFLEAQFGEEIEYTDIGVDIKVDETIAKIDLTTLQVDCLSGPLKDRVVHTLTRAIETISPFAEASLPWNGVEYTNGDKFC
ncbi:Endoribonuclease ysh1 [Neolecta irregularis DAH-3]|uniref:Endoribonuclease YSH1 n=1 Tax=Neolecta irregularis (strain DAH-3) TaxID=1198029 RepID=A0A1U7LMP8_NEOID|nr:Endoribonuclease ysh1 [Neolecta irregularis DAH-3]|eukprot:OLL23919.1 Endoribonuclease ysh1 [Neolecta irregularis DAH-3]